MHQKRWQGKIVNQMRFIAIAEIFEIFMRRYICFGNQPNIIIHMVNQRAHQFDDFMSFGQMQATRSRLFPQKADRIEAKYAYALINIKAQQADKFEQ